MSSTPQPTSSDSFLASLNILDAATSSPTAAPKAAPQGKFQTLSLGIVSPAGNRGGGGVGGKGVTDSNSIQVLPGLAIGVVIAHVLEPEELCCGLIGNSGTKFCIKSKDCTTSTYHKEKCASKLVISGAANDKVCSYIHNVPEFEFLIFIFYCNSLNVRFNNFIPFSTNALQK
jgi:hypothetical protein